MSEYTDFVKRNVNKMPGKTATMRMKQVAALWRKKNKKTKSKKKQKVKKNNFFYNYI